MFEAMKKTTRGQGGAHDSPPLESIKGNNNYNIFSLNSKSKACILIFVISLFYMQAFHPLLISIALYTGLGLSTIAVGGSIALRLAFKLEDFKILQATRIKRQNEARTLTASHKSQVWWIEGNRPKQLHPNEAPLQRLPLLESETKASRCLLTELSTADRVLIKGSSNAGKTNLLKHIASDRVISGDVFVIDPHTSPNKWGNCQVIGGGSNYNEVSSTLDSFISEMVSRYQDLAEGIASEESFKPLTIIIDEFMSISGQCKNAKDVIVRLITESRKASFSLFIGTHSDRVESLGLKGQGDIREGLVFVHLYNEGGQRSATIDYGKGEIETIPAPLFYGFSDSSQGTPTTLLKRPTHPNPTSTAPSTQDFEISELRASGLSLGKISLQVYGNKGGMQNNLIREAVERVESYKASKGGNGYGKM